MPIEYPLDERYHPNNKCINKDLYYESYSRKWFKYCPFCGVKLDDKPVIHRGKFSSKLHQRSASRKNIDTAFYDVEPNDLFTKLGYIMCEHIGCFNIAVKTIEELIGENETVTSNVCDQHG